MSNKLVEVGDYRDDFNQKLNLNLPCLKIFQSDGLREHIRKRHPNCLRYINNIPDIIKNPDYIGTNPQEPNSIELIKNYGMDIQIAIKLENDGNYFYVATMFDVRAAKIANKLNSGRIKKY